MKMVIQRVNHAECKVDGKVTGAIGKGFLVFLGVGHGDNEEIADKYVKKLVGMRIFEDSEGKTDEHPGLHFLDPEEDHAPTEEMPEEWPGFTVGIHRNKCHPCPIKLALGLAGSTALAAILIRKRH